jgi:hypothetical protein
MTSQSIFGAQGASLPKCSRENPCSQGKIVGTCASQLNCSSHRYTDVNQFSIITELLGTPPDDVIETICSENVRPLQSDFILR